MDFECVLYLFWISFHSRELNLARLVTPTIMQESGHNWDFLKDCTTTGDKQHVGKLQAFCAYAVQWVGTYTGALSFWITSVTFTALLQKAKQHMHKRLVIAGCIELSGRNTVSWESVRKEEFGCNHTRLREAVRLRKTIRKAAMWDRAEEGLESLERGHSRKASECLSYGEREMDTPR